MFVSLVLAKQIDRQMDDSSGHVFMSPEQKDPNFFVNTVDSLLTDTSIRRDTSVNGHLELVPAFSYSLYLTLYKTDISLRRTLSSGLKGVRLGES